MRKLPGVGPKTAQRIAFHLVDPLQTESLALAQAIVDAKKKISYCQRCFHMSEKPICEICTSPRRDDGLICVVADSKDLMALEQTQEYHGHYHVLGGVISPMDGIGPEELHIHELISRLKGANIREVILAIGPSIEGEATNLYLNRLLSPLTKVTQIAFGLPIGGDLDQADSLTIARSLQGRREVD